MGVGNEKSGKRKEEGMGGGLKFFLGPKLEEKRFEEVTRERFCERIEMGVSS